MLKFSRLVSWPVVVWWSYIGEGALRCSLYLSPKGSWWLPNVFIFTIHPFSLESTDDTTFLGYIIFVFGSHQKAFDSIASLEVYLDPMLPANILYTFTESLYIRKHHVWLLVPCCSPGVNIWLCSLLMLCLTVLAFDLNPVQGPKWIFVSCQDFLEVIFFLFQELVVGTHSFCPVMQGIYDTVFCCNGVVTIPLQI